MKKIGLDGLSGAISEVLLEFENASYEAIRSAADKTAQEVIKQTKAAAPVRKGRYKAGWGKTVVNGNSRRYAVTVHNKKRAGLAHLLEHGHGGPRPAGAHPHITPDEETEKLFTENLRKEMEK